MFTFLKKIRRQLIHSNNTKKYFAYAVGEIALVVIGILIALQINNWNEAQKDKELEHKMLIELVDDLKSDTLYLGRQIRRGVRMTNDTEIMLTKPAFHDSLIPHFQIFGGLMTLLNKRTIESIQASGENIISDDILRNQIHSYYQYADFLMSINEFTQDIFAEADQIPFQKKHFIRKQDDSARGYHYMPKDYDDLIKSQDLDDYLLERRSRLYIVSRRYRQIKGLAAECIKSINVYLNQNQ